MCVLSIILLDFAFLETLHTANAQSHYHTLGVV